MLDCLSFYVNTLRWAVFPCSNKTKKPITEHSFKDASRDIAQIESWYRQYPDCAWGTPTTAAKGVIDVDPRHGGDKAIAILEVQHGPLPTTPKVRTGGGGHHYWFRFPEGTGCAGGETIARGIDRKADGGFVIIPPSKILIPEHEGRKYTWEVRPWETPLAEAPAWALASAKPKGKADASADNPWVAQEAEADLLTHPGCQQGQRRDTFCRLVGVHLARGDSKASIRAMAEAWAMRCKPPFDGQPEPVDHWERHLAGLLKREARKMTTPLSLSPTRISPEQWKERINSDPEPKVEGELFPSFPCAESGEREKRLSSTKHILQPEAYHGRFGQMLKAVSPETEADPAGILLGWLTCFGNVIGRGAYFTVGSRRHYPALNVGVVGNTSDAKGDSWGVSLYPFKQVEPQWYTICIANGVGSGEGLLERIRDEQQVMNRKGEVEEMPGADDKRCLLRLSELSRCFKVGRREGNPLSELLREAWDGEPIHIPNRGSNGLSATDYTVSLVGDITPQMLRKILESGTEAFDGFANRFLWCAVQRSCFLPSGGNIDVLKPFLKPLAEALTFAKNAGEMKRDAEAEWLWESVYPQLTVSGDTIPHTERARPYVVRLSMIYALADRSATIKVEHLRAALAVWEYCRASARLLLGGQPEPIPDPLSVRLLNAILKEPGINRTRLWGVAGHNVKVEEMDAAFAFLKKKGLAHHRMVQPEGAGRPAECWFPGPAPEPDSNGDTVEDDNPLSFPPEQTSANAGKEGINSEQEPSAFGKERQEGINSDNPPEGVELIPSFHCSGQGNEERVSSFPPADDSQVETGVSEGEKRVVNQHGWDEAEELGVQDSEFVRELLAFMQTP